MLRRDRPLDVLDPRQERVVVDVDLDQPDAHQLGAEPEAEVHRHRRDDLGLGLAAPGSAASRIAARFDSVPPVVMNPPAPPSPPSSDAIIADGLALHRPACPSSVSSAHSTKNRPWASASTRRLIADGIPE